MSKIPARFLLLLLYCIFSVQWGRPQNIERVYISQKHVICHVKGTTLGHSGREGSLWRRNVTPSPCTALGRDKNPLCSYP